jgi:hypothetical protein
VRAEGASAAALRAGDPPSRPSTEITLVKYPAGVRGRKAPAPRAPAITLRRRGVFRTRREHKVFVHGLVKISDQGDIGTGHRER